MTECIRLLLVDDHDVLRQGIRFMLQHEDTLDVMGEAADGEAALEMIRNDQPDVVLLDVQMPGMGGLPALERIKQVHPGVAVVILSMFDDPEYVEQALRSGASGYLLKTASREELVRAVTAAAGGDGYLQAEITRPVLQRFAMAPAPDLEISLSPRERDVLQAIADGQSTKQAAKELGISESTVKTYLRQLFEKMGATHRAHAVALALRLRIID